MIAPLDRFQGCLLGLALGDALGAPFEGGLPERILWRLIGRTKRGEMRWTDDTQMSVDVLESLLAKGTVNPDDLAVRFARSYRWSRGYGPATAKLLRRIARGAHWSDANRSVYPTGSFGNGAAMRAPVVGLFHADRSDDLPDATRQSAIVTHAHEQAIEGAVLVALATAGAARQDASPAILDRAESCCSLEPFRTRLARARTWLESRSDVTTGDVVRELGHRVSARESCVTALYLALRFRDQPFLDMQRFMAACGGDADTIGAMAGAIWGAANGAIKLPREPLDRLEQRERLAALAAALHERCANRDGFAAELNA